MDNRISRPQFQVLVSPFINLFRFRSHTAHSVLTLLGVATENGKASCLGALNMRLVPKS